MTPKEMLNAFKEAEKLGIITDLEEYAYCVEASVKCEDCPAQKTCIQLSNENDFEVKFNELIRPLIEDEKNHE
jgi:Zn-finger domain-containing protein